MTNHADMISRCVRAVREDQRWAFWEEDDARDFVRIVLKEMRRPTPEMIAAGPRGEYGIMNAEAVHIWEAMIDSAGGLQSLKEPPE